MVEEDTCYKMEEEEEKGTYFVCLQWISSVENKRE
jgi:hypothetical protein